MQAIKDKLSGALIVSCQPVVGGPMDSAGIIVAFALAAIDGGAHALRIEGAANVAAVRAATRKPIIGLIKRDLAESPVRITPLEEDVDVLIAAGADIIAFDATERARPVPAAALCNRVRRAGRLTMADCATLSDVRAAMDFGADFIGTTLSGYTGGPEPDDPDLDLVRRAAKLGGTIIAEGRIRTPDQASAAMAAGAHAVVVGSAITRPEHITSWFVSAIGAPGKDVVRA